MNGIVGGRKKMRAGFKLVSALLVFTWIVIGMGRVHGAEVYPDPSKTITIIAPFAPGGTDSQFRAIGAYLSKYLGGVKVQIENVVGASGKLSYAKVYKAQPDGYTIMGYSLPAPVIAEIEDKSARFKISELVPLCSYTTTPNVLVVHVDNWKTLDEFVQEGQKRALSIGTTGNTTGNYFQAVNLAELTKIKANIVPFEGGRESTAALAGKHIDAVCTQALSPLPLVRAGKLRALIIFGDDPYPGYTGVPLLNDSKWDFVPFPIMNVFVGPPNLPADKQKILEGAFSKSLKDPEFLKWAANASVTINYKNSEQVQAFTAKVFKNILQYQSYLPKQ
jgi:tripartite-type tricarboxylate transporter receptor subunit TctC